MSSRLARVITQVSIPSKWGGLYDTASSGKAEFRLGKGPCLKVVTKLTVTWYGAPDRIIVRQDYEEGPSKDFIYLVKDLTGRIEVTYRD
jgi:hypothetical protein